MPSLLGWLLLQGGSFLPLACVGPADAAASAPVEGSAPTRGDSAAPTLVHGTAPTNSHSPDAPQGPADTKRDLAVTRARETLRTMGVDPSSLTVTEAKPVTWPDSSLGCPEQGIQYLQMLTPGYQVELQGTQGNYRVHVAGNRAIVCTGTGTGTGTRLKRPLVPVRGIDVMTQRAKEMLAAAVHASADQIHVAGWEPQVWPDTGLGCPSAPPAVPGRVSGYRIVLQHGGREYTFNTDLHRVIACPAIDAE